MGLRLRGQLVILCCFLVGISLSIISYFNVGVFRLSFLADEEQRVRALGLRTGERIIVWTLEGPVDCRSAEGSS